jgi:glutamyl-tRNA(Gln) amidotransferase subunit D (EC 6.3.5.7)
MNAVSAVRLATADAAGVFVCMHAGPSDDECAVHAGTRVRKNHTSRRDAFVTVDGPPLGSVSYPDGVVTLDDSVPPRGDADVSVATALETDVELLYFSPGGDVRALGERLRERAPAGLVIAGTGLGHVHAELIDAIGALVEAGTSSR